jgi:spore maturation protein CgeB
MKYDFVFLGLSVTSSWGNGHATTYRGLLRELTRRGHRVLFLERDVPWYAQNRDLPQPPYGRTELYSDLDDLAARFGRTVRDARVVVVGSYVPEGAAVAEWMLETATGLRAFYDIDTPVTVARLAKGGAEYLTPALVPRFDLYLSFTGGPTLLRLKEQFGAREPRALYCSADPELYFPERRKLRWHMGYLGTYSADRQPGLERLMLQPAAHLADARFVVAGPMYPESITWPANVERVEHIAPPEHRGFYNAQLMTLNVTRADMVRAGWSPSVRLFEAAACGTPIVTDAWDGLDSVFEPQREILVATSPEEAQHYLSLPPTELRAVGARARRRVLAEHTAARRAEQLEGHVLELAGEATRRALRHDRAAAG